MQLIILIIITLMMLLPMYFVTLWQEYSLARLSNYRDNEVNAQNS